METTFLNIIKISYIVIWVIGKSIISVLKMLNQGTEIYTVLKHHEYR